MRAALSRFLIRQAKCAARDATIDKAIQYGKLEVKCIETKGKSVHSLTERGDEPLTVRTIKSLLRHSKAGNQVGYYFDDVKEVPGEQSSYLERHRSERSRIWKASNWKTRRQLLRATEPISPVHLAAILLLERGLLRSGLSARKLLDIFKKEQPIIAIACQALEFDRVFQQLFEEGILFGKAAKFADGYAINGPTARPNFDRFPATTWEVILYSQRQERPERSPQIGYALMTGYPVFALAETPDQFPEELRTAADAVLDCGVLDYEILRQVARIATDVLLPEPDPKPDLSAMSLPDITIAIRPHLNAQQMESKIWGVGLMRKSPQRDHASPAGNWNEITRERKARNRKPTGSEIIWPVRPEEGEKVGVLGESLSTLAGYGKAKAWGLDLKLDLDDFKEGRVEWGDLMTKVLLVGKPGTGKTTFARALCNTLEVPLVATSAATWLEPSYLGDVLKRMSSAFEEARDLAPCILFIDEFDGIGHRHAGGQYSDYWNNVINKALELLDGVSRTEGVIVVGATNHCDQIDAALLRSGRLEKRFNIELPDIGALSEIFRTHLQSDVENVVASAPLCPPTKVHVGSSGRIFNLSAHPSRSSLN